MQSQLVFQEKKERERLRIQNKLLSQAEKPALEHFFKGKSGLSVLDIGCNDGNRTFQRFSDQRVSRVIGLEYNQELVEKAHRQYGNSKFFFYQMDVESQSFSKDLQNLVDASAGGQFDLICLSFVLMHLLDGKKLLRTLEQFLKKDGVLFITESNDCASTLVPDEKNLLEQFLDILNQDKYAGRRDTGAKASGWLADFGYGNIHVWSQGISAGKEELERKNQIFQTFFSYLPEDVEILLEEEPDNRDYQEWQKWLGENYEGLRQQILSKDSEITMGMQILSCEKVGL